jgi:ethanolamine utilization protein EutQ (cupin superfamily)
LKSYLGSRTIDGIVVSVDGRPLDERYDIRRFTNSGFEWTYNGDAPRQLALALLADHLGDADKALELSAGFMKAKIADLDNDWTLTSEDIDSVLKELTSG